MLYPAFYKLFEQKRLVEKKPKSKARKEAEMDFGVAGYERRHGDGTNQPFHFRYRQDGCNLQCAAKNRALSFPVPPPPRTLLHANNIDQCRHAASGMPSFQTGK